MATPALPNWVLPTLLALLLGIGTGCTSTSYYWQAARGQYELLARRTPIPAILARTNTPSTLSNRLALVLELRAYAGRELRLPVNGHYSDYVNLGRPYVVWNVYAAPPFSLEPKQWWYPVVGRLDYRGFFSEADAQSCARKLAAQGYDVHVGGVEAYSTLGWFKDPVLNTFAHHAPADLAEILFHELAHQRVFASGDTDFNEAFASCVGEEGVRRWLRSREAPQALAEYEAELARQEQFVALILGAREQLNQVYAGTNLTNRAAAKEATLTRLRENYQTLKQSWGGRTDYDAWFNRPLNNAHLNTVATYRHLVPAFQQLLHNHGGDLARFFQAAETLAGLKKEQRGEQIAALLQQHRQASRLAWLR